MPRCCSAGAAPVVVPSSRPDGAPAGTKVNGIPWVPSTSVSWRVPSRMTGCTAPWLPSQGDRGSCTAVIVATDHQDLERSRRARAEVDN